MVSNYESRLERLEQQIAAPIAQRLIAYLFDGDTRPADWMEVRGQRFDRGVHEDEDDFRQRVWESLGVSDYCITVVHYVGTPARTVASATTKAY